MNDPSTFAVEVRGDTLIITPKVNLSELDYERIECDGTPLLEKVDEESVKYAVVDMVETDYYGSSALSLFVRVWKRLRLRGGHMAVCNVSENERQILTLTRFDSIWTVSNTLEDALREVRLPPG